MHAREPRVFAAITTGVPDGFTVDIEGNVFASPGESVHVLAPDGTWLGTIPVPERVGNCTFGGVNGDRKFIIASTSL